MSLCAKWDLTTVPDGSSFTAFDLDLKECESRRVLTSWTVNRREMSTYELAGQGDLVLSAQKTDLYQVRALHQVPICPSH